MASPALTQIVNVVLQGVVNIATGEVRGRIRRAGVADRADLPSFSEGLEDLELPDTFRDLATGEIEPRLPLLDAEHELGDTFAPPEEREFFPKDLLDVVVGLDHEKRLIRSVVVSQNYRLHVLMVGPPGSAKSLILDLIRAGIPEQSRIVVGNQATAAGMKKLLLDAGHPRILLFEELDKAPREAQEAMLTAMDGIVTDTTGAPGGQRENLNLEVHIIAAANDLKPLIAPLRDRFITLHLRDYTPAERHEVMEKVLEERMDFSPAEAKQIADLVAPKGTIRDAEHIGALWKDDPEVARAHVERLGVRH